MDFLTLCWAIHRVGGIALLLHPTSSAAEIESHVKQSKCSAVFTNHILLNTCLEGTGSAGMSTDKVYILDFPGDAKPADESASSRLSVETLISEGRSLDSIETVNFDNDDENVDRVALFCPTSGTSGMQVRDSTSTQLS